MKCFVHSSRHGDRFEPDFEKFSADFRYYIEILGFGFGAVSDDCPDVAIGIVINPGDALFTHFAGDEGTIAKWWLKDKDRMVAVERNILAKLGYAEHITLLRQNKHLYEQLFKWGKRELEGPIETIEYPDVGEFLREVDRRIAGLQKLAADKTRQTPVRQVED